MIKLVKGSAEPLPVSVKDRVGDLTTLDDAVATFRVLKTRDQSETIPWTSASTIGMTAYCPIDTTSWEQNRYQLLLKLVIDVYERPILGPFDFEVI